MATEPVVERSRKVCPSCLGGGISNYVTREMAADAGDIRMTGEEIRCTECKGDGWIYD